MPAQVSAASWKPPDGKFTVDGGTGNVTTQGNADIKGGLNVEQGADIKGDTTVGGTADIAGDTNIGGAT